MRATFVTGDTATLFVCAAHEILNATFYKLLEIDSPSISKRLVECTMRYFHAQHARTIMLPCRRRQNLPRVWLA